MIDEQAAVIAETQAFAQAWSRGDAKAAAALVYGGWGARRGLW